MDTKNGNSCIFMAIINSWVEYYQNCKKLNIPTIERIFLLKFRLRLADNLINVRKLGTPKRSRGRPRESSSLGNSPSSSTRKRYNTKEIRPFNETKTDQIGHFPASDDNTDVHLCFVVKKNTVLPNIINDFMLINNKLKRKD